MRRLAPGPQKEQRPVKYDAFISYAHVDKSLARQILARLEALDLTVWIDEERIDTFESIKRSITEGLQRSKTVLALYSKAYLQSRACQWELTGTLLASQSEEGPCRLMVANPENAFDHILPVELQDALFAEIRESDPSTLDDLAADVSRHAKSFSSPIGSGVALARPRWFGLNPVGIPKFVGRLRAMWELHSALRRAGALVGERPAPHVAQVRGLGGMGKTLLVEEYALRFGASFPGGVFWLRAPNSPSPRVHRQHLHLQLSVLAAQQSGADVSLGLDALSGLIAGRINDAGTQCLWVVDDLPAGVSQEVFRMWLGPSPLCRTVVTTRSRQYPGDAVDLGKFAENEAVDLLGSHIDVHRESQAKSVRNLANDLGCHPLACEVAGAYLAGGLLEVEEYRRSLQDPAGDVLEYAAALAGVLPHDHEKSIAATLLRSIESLSETGLDFLRLASVLAAAPIPAPLVRGVFDLIGVSALRRGVGGVTDCESLSLVDSVSVEPRAWRVHELVTRTMRYKEKRSSRIETISEAATQTLYERMHELCRMDRAKREDYEVDHAEFVSRCPSSLIQAELRDRVARYQYNFAAYEAARDCAQDALDFKTKTIGSEHPRALQSTNNLADILSALGDLSTAGDLYAQASRGWQAAGYEDEALKSANGLAELLRQKGELASAIELHRSTLPRRRQLLGDLDNDTIVSASNLALALLEHRELDEAREVLEWALPAAKRALGLDHPNTWSVMNTLAEVLRQQGQLDDALHYHQGVLSYRKQALPAGHPETLSSINNLALTYIDLGRFDEARVLLTEACAEDGSTQSEHGARLPALVNNLALAEIKCGHFAIAKERLEAVIRVFEARGEGARPWALMSLDNLGLAHYGLRNWSESLRCHLRAYETRRSILGPLDPDTITSGGNYASALSASGDAHIARSVIADMHKEARAELPESHPLVLTLLHNASVFDVKAKDFEAGLTGLKSVVERRSQILPAGHPDRLVAMYNLARALLLSNKKLEALQVHRAAYDEALAAHGPDHPLTLQFGSAPGPS